MTSQAFNYGTHGHRHGPTIDGDDQSTHRDGRVRPDHIHARSNVRGPTGCRTHPVGGPLPGIARTIAKICVTCGEQKLANEFENHAVAADLRCHDGFNITCRTCQVAQYSRGYKLDGFVVADEEEDSDEDSDDEDEEEDDSDEEEDED